MSWTITTDDDGTLNIRAVLRPNDIQETSDFMEAMRRKLEEHTAEAPSATFAAGNGAFTSGHK